MTQVDDQIKTGIRRLIAEKGRKVEISDQDNWNNPRGVSIYGWGDYNASEHIDGEHLGRGKGRGPGCEWIVPEGTVVEEVSYTQFVGTFTSNRDEIGLNAPGINCKCGKYTNVTLRVDISLGEAIQALIGYDSTRRMEL